MKKINLLFSTLMIALVILVASGATIAPAMQLNATMALNTAGTTSLKGTELFDSKGRYQMDLADLTYDKTYQFFGYDWHLVLVKSNVATFWMADPYAETYFNKPTRSGNLLYNDASNVWANGYSKTTWKSDYYTSGNEVTIGESAIRKYLNDAAKNIIDNKSYANYQDKVLAGAFNGNNQDNDAATQVVRDMKYALTSLNNTTKDPEANQITANYALDSSDRLWLPSVGDLHTWGIATGEGVNAKVADDKVNLVKWTETTISNTAWLRNADKDESNYALIMSYDGTFSARSIEKQAGVRPAIHLNIADISTEYQAHLDDASGNGKKDWWNETWLQVLFMVVCILGIVGVILVIVAVVVRNRKANASTNDSDEE